MIPKIEKLTLAELSLSTEAKKEVRSIIRNKKNILGFKFRVLEDRCVMVGKKPENDFNIWRAVRELEDALSRKSIPAPERYRFVFLSVA